MAVVMGFAATKPEPRWSGRTCCDEQRLAGRAMSGFGDATDGILHLVKLWEFASQAVSDGHFPVVGCCAFTPVVPTLNIRAHQRLAKRRELPFGIRANLTRHDPSGYPFRVSHVRGDSINTLSGEPRALRELNPTRVTLHPFSLHNVARTGLAIDLMPSWEADRAVADMPAVPRNPPSRQFAAGRAPESCRLRHAALYAPGGALAYNTT